MLQVDHINSNWRDNRPDNLRFLCPNCHSQTDSYYNKKGPIKIKQKKVRKQGRLESALSKETLEKLLWEKPTTHIAKKYGVSDSMIAKLCNKYHLTKPPRGYWTKEKFKKRN